MKDSVSIHGLRSIKHYNEEFVSLGANNTLDLNVRKHEEYL